MSLRTIPDMDRIVETIEKKHTGKALVIGGGFIGLEMVENLKRRGLDVAIIEMLDQLMPPFDHEMAALIHHELENNNVAVWLNEQVNGFEDRESSVSVTLQNGRTIDVDFVILAAGVMPEGALAEACGLRMGMKGSIIVNDRMNTSDPDIYAVGDAVQVFRFADGSSTLLPLAGPAAKEARVAVNNIFGIKTRFRGVQGTSICRVFGITAACTGLNEKTLQALAQPYEKVYVHPTNHAGYYPGAYSMTLKVLYKKDTGTVLGAQCIGPEGIDKRIDVLSMAIQANMTMRDLSEAELCYAPPFGSLKDPVNVAGHVAVNAEDGVMPLTHWDHLEERKPGEFVLIDVRTPPEYHGGHVPGSLNIPIDQTKERISEYEQYRDREIILYCATGFRSHIVGCILRQKGFRVSNLSGGFKTYCQFHPKTCAPE